MKTNNLINQIQAYLSNGGLFNPELANHIAVRDLLIECREALANHTENNLVMVQEPIGEAHLMQSGFTHCIWSETCVPVGAKLYTTPPQRKPLTELQITEIYTKWESTKGTSWADLIRAIESAHGIKE